MSAAAPESRGTASRAAPCVAALGVSKIYRQRAGEVVALKRASLSLFPGQMCALLGPSGSGKSTLLHILGLLDAPTSGRVFYDGVDAPLGGGRAADTFRRMRIGFIFQSGNLVPVLSALENVEIPLLHAALSGAQRRDRARSALARVGLSHRAHHRPSGLSGGEQQRVAAARALVAEPAIVLADEPTASLDATAAAGLLDCFATLQQGTRTAFLIATHDARVTERVDRCCHVQDGVLVE